MKKAAFIFIVIIALIACKRKGAIELSGCWVNEQYINAVQSDTPVRNAQMTARAIWFNKKDNDTALFILNFHEGVNIVLQKTHGAYWFDGSFMDSKDTAVTVKNAGDDKINVGNTIYKRLPVDTNILGEPAVLEYILFRGKYTTSIGKEVEFMPDGRVTGLDTINYYHPLTDYMDEGLNVDEVMLGRNIKSQTYYGFKFNKDTLTVFNVRCKEWDSTTHQCGVVEYGSVLYKMWKHK